MRHANEHDARLLKESVLARDGPSVCYYVLYYGYPNIIWSNVIKNLPDGARKFVRDSLLKCEDMLEREEHSW